jgi:hypothetical protein
MYTPFPQLSMSPLSSSLKKLLFQTLVIILQTLLKSRCCLFSQLTFLLCVHCLVCFPTLGYTL